MANWPVSLPQRPLAGSFEMETVDAVVRNQPDVGPPMARLRASTDYDVMQGSFHLTRLEYELLMAFYRTDCEFGSLTFNGPHWLTEEQVIYRWAGPPKVSHIEAEIYRVGVQLIRMPGT